MKTLLTTSFVIVTLITACSPSPEIVATAMAQTEAARPSSTPLPPTATSTPEPTGTPTVTLTPTVTATGTPDLRVITSDVKDIVCGKDDFPAEGGYYLPGPDVFTNVWTDPMGYEHTDKYYTYFSHTQFQANLDAIQKHYVQVTGRLDGWYVEYRKSISFNYAGPEYIDCTVEKFKTAQGARLAVLQYNATILTGSSAWDEIGWKYYPEAGITIGDASAVLVNPTFEKSNANRGYLEIDFSYQNFRVRILQADSEAPTEINIDAIDYVAKQILKKLQSKPLSASPQTTP